MLSDGTARRKPLCNPWHCKSINRGIKNGRSNLGTGTIKTAITRDRQGAFDPAWLHISSNIHTTFSFYHHSCHQLLDHASPNFRCNLTLLRRSRPRLNFRLPVHSNTLTDTRAQPASFGPVPVLRHACVVFLILLTSFILFAPYPHTLTSLVW